MYVRFLASAALYTSISIIAIILMGTLPPQQKDCFSILTLYKNTCDLKRTKP